MHRCPAPAARSNSPPDTPPRATPVTKLYLDRDPRDPLPQQPSRRSAAPAARNLQPYLAINYIISLFGIFPRRPRSSWPIHSSQRFGSSRSTSRPPDGRRATASCCRSSQNTALFSLLGTIYGGDGKSNFALPDIQGQVVIHPGQGPGTERVLPGPAGRFAGPSRCCSPRSRPTATPGGPRSTTRTFQVPARIAPSRPQPGVRLPNRTRAQNLAPMNPQTLNAVGGSTPHNNMQPYLVLTSCIALQGVFPPRS